MDGTVAPARGLGGYQACALNEHWVSHLLSEAWLQCVELVVEPLLDARVADLLQDASAESPQR